MRVSDKWLRELVDVTDDKEVIANKMLSVGNEYESINELCPSTNLVVGRVVSKYPHPDSDHLNVCEVDLGDKIYKIVCGAPNVCANQKVIVAKVGAKLPAGEIKCSTIRGVLSNGMICSLAELGLESKYVKEEDKKGIHVLNEDAPVGVDAKEYLNYNDSYTDYELTSNRGDLLSMIGMAYEVGAIYNKKVNMPEINLTESKEKTSDYIEIENQTNNCYAYKSRIVKNVVIKESPSFIKARLMSSGIRPINNVVDISNYVMLEVGQPLHYYDADTLNGCLEVRMAEENEKLTTLDDVERTLSREDIVISDGKKAIGLAGVMGGLETEITENTKNIMIESAIFDNVKIRKTSKEILRSEASNRFEKGLDPNRTYMAIERSCHLLEKYADAKIVGGLVKYDEASLEDTKIDVSLEKVNKVLGTTISKEDVLDVFRKLAFETEVNGDKITVSVPKRRIDISIEEDLIEEVGRIYGVNNIEGKLPSLPLKQGSYNKTLRNIRNKMIDLGLNETLSYILVNDKEATKYTTDNVEIVKLLDPMTEERNTLRYSMIPSLVKIYEYNKARSQKDVSIFEIGKGFYKKDEQYGENLKLCALMTGERYLSVKSKQVDFYDIKGVAEELLDYLGYGGRYSFVVKEELPKEFHPYQTAQISVNNDIVGIIGKLHPNCTKDNVYVLEINLDKLLEKKTGKMKYKEISKFPSVKKDLAVVIDKDITSEEIAKQIKKLAGNLLLGSKIFDVYTGENIEENKKSIAYSLEFGAADRTLTDDEINAILEKIIAGLEKQGAIIRK